jgi:lactoylglutathione lyase
MLFRVFGLFVRNVQDSVAFYERAFGFPLRYSHPSGGYAELETGATLLAFVSERFLDDAALIGGRAIRPNRPELDPIAAQVAFVSDELERDWQRAVAAGAVVVKEPQLKPWGQVAGYLRDLDGFLVELATRSPRD